MLSQLALFVALTARAQPSEAAPEDPASPFAAAEGTVVDPPASAPAPVPPSPAIVQVVPSRVERLLWERRAQWWTARDEKLRKITVGFALTTILAGGVGAGLLAARTQASSVGALRALSAFGSLLSAGAVVSLVGTSVGGVTWGNHRNHKGDYVTDRELIDAPI